MKSLLLFNLILIGGLNTAKAEVVTSDRFIIKILDRTVSLLDVQFQQRNLEALNCIYDDAFVVQYFGKLFITDLRSFVEKFPTLSEEDVRKYLHGKEDLLKKTRTFFKMLRYSEDQKTDVSPKLTKLIRQSAKENKCGQDVLYKDTLKTNFISLMEMELYLRARYGSQLKTHQGFEAIRSSIELFAESLDKQFAHEYYW